jgi:folate-binding protein YgfZ
MSSSHSFGENRIAGLRLVFQDWSLLLSMPLESPLLDLHRSAGAELAEYFGTLLPEQYKTFAAEYAAARDAVALIDSNYRACFSFSGPDAQRYLNAILTSNVRDLAAGQGAVGLLLTAQGHISAEVETLRLPDRLLAISHALVRDRTFSTFDKFIIMDDVTLEDFTQLLGTLDLVGPQAAAVVSQVAGVDITAGVPFSHFDATIGSISCRIVCHSFANQPAAMLITSRESLAELWQILLDRVRAYAGGPAGMRAVNSLRLESGTAWFGHDYDDKNIPHEAGLEHSHISYEKGCYTGQEIVERVRSRGHVNRRLTEMKFLAETSPAPQTKLTATVNDAVTEVGYVTSSGFSPLLALPLGLGYVRREHSAIGKRLDASGIIAEVVLPPLSEKKVTA